MRFIWPSLLWLLLLIPALVAAYLYVLRRKKRAAIRYASLMLVRDAIAPGQSVRRHLPPALFLCAMTLAVFAVARPSAVLMLPSEYSTVILTMDVSRSMLATDVPPSRIVAAQAAATQFVNELPRGVRLGIVSFASTAFLVQAPTENREELTGAIERFQLQRGTATGSGLLVALATMFPDDGIDVEAAVYNTGSFGSPFGRQGGSSLDRTRKDKREKKPVVAVPVGSYRGGSIILLSDGRRTTGPDPLEVAKMAADRGVRVYTVGFGSQAGANIPSMEGWSFWATLDEKTLKQVAGITGGEYYQAVSGDDLGKIYEKLNTRLALERKDTEISGLLSAFAALLIIAAGLLSVLWFNRRM